jgi:hypothetical protein
MKKLSCCIVLLILMTVSFPLYGGIYSWTDENGVKHFSDTAPSQDTEDVDLIETPEHSKPSDDYNEQKSDSFSPKLSSDEISLVKAMKEKGVLPQGISIENITPESLKYLEMGLKETYGIDDIRAWTRDPQFSSPENTWAAYKEALIAGDFDHAQRCHTPDKQDYIEVYRELGKEKTKELVQAMRPIQKVIADDQRAKYRIRRNDGGHEITYYIYFYNVLGEWKIDKF